MAFADGVFGATVWPVYVGLANVLGDEPWACNTYKREMIRWEHHDNTITGQADVFVGPGEYPYMVFTHTPNMTVPPTIFTPFQHPILFSDEAHVSLRHITQADFTTKAFHKMKAAQ